MGSEMCIRDSPRAFSSDQSVAVTDALLAHAKALGVINGISELAAISAIAKAESDRYLAAQKRRAGNKEMCRLLQEAYDRLYPGFSNLSLVERETMQQDVPRIKGSLSDPSKSFQLQRSMSSGASKGGEADPVLLLQQGLVLALRLDVAQRINRLSDLRTEENLDSLRNALSDGCTLFFLPTAWSGYQCQVPGDPPGQVFELGLLSRGQRTKSSTRAAEMGTLFWAADVTWRSFQRSELKALAPAFWKGKELHDSADWRPSDFLDWLQTELGFVGEGGSINTLVNEVKAALEKP